MKLNQKNLLAAAELLKVPTYNRQKLKSGIVHIGVGGFHRAHQAVVIQNLLELDGNEDWGICGIGLREADRKIAEVFSKQDCLYTLITRHPDGKVQSEVMGQMTDFLLAADNQQAVVERISHKDTKILSLTITEGGYNLRSDGKFDLDHPDIQHELNNPSDPKTIYGYLSAALRIRKENGQAPFTIMSCDNIQHNGDVTRKMLLSFLSAQDKELASWVEKEVAFPNSMVDRITPVTTPAEIDYLKDEFNLDDEWPVTCEPFLQWVIEDKFSNGRPALEKVGAQFVPDVTPYEKMKLRLLNAGHSVLGILGSIHGHETIGDCVNDPVFSAYLKSFMDLEVTPVLDQVDGVDLSEYKSSLIERFSNPNIKDHVSRICSESSAKLPKFLIPTIHENLAKGGSTEYATLILAAWCYYSDKGLNQRDEPLDIIDAMQEELHMAAKGTSTDTLSFLRLRALFNDLIDNHSFTDLYSKLVSSIYENPNIRQLMGRKTV
ncbi:MAG: mannitol dehydrogenase family protein [Cyclobacteriaceae bacterium]